MSSISLSSLFIILLILLVFSGFFSVSETSFLSLNRYRLKHLAKGRHKQAEKALQLLKNPDRLISGVLIGNNFANIFASAIATIIGERLYGDIGIALAAGILTIVVLVFCEISPKVIAALYPEKIAFRIAFLVAWMQTLLRPFVIITNFFAHALIRLFGINPKQALTDTLSIEELKTVLNEATGIMPRKHKEMLVGILDLEKIPVEHIMVPRQEVVGIDLNEEWPVILEELRTSQHTRLPLYRETLDQVIGILHLREIIHFLSRDDFDLKKLEAQVKLPFFIPEGTSLNSQLLNFQKNKQRLALVVDEYGDVKGLVTLEDILEEIVGEFTTNYIAVRPQDILKQPDGSYLVEGTTNIRELNRLMHWDLPTEHARTVNGLITEALEAIPQPGVSLKINDYPIEIVQTSGNAVKAAKIFPKRAE